MTDDVIDLRRCRSERTDDTKAIVVVRRLVALMRLLDIGLAGVSRRKEIRLDEGPQGSTTSSGVVTMVAPSFSN